MCRDHEWRVCGFADVDVRQSSDLPDPIKLKAAGVVLAQQLACYPPIDFFLLYLQCL